MPAELLEHDDGVGPREPVGANANTPAAASSSYIARSKPAHPIRVEAAHEQRRDAITERGLVVVEIEIQAQRGSRACPTDVRR